MSDSRRIPIPGIRPIADFLVISVQIPFEIGIAVNTGASLFTYLFVYEHGAPAGAIMAAPGPAEPHVERRVAAAAGAGLTRE